MPRKKASSAVTRAHRAQVFSVPAHAALIDSVVAGIIADTRSDPLALADHLVLVADSDTAQALRRAFVSQLGEEISVLPRVEALDRLSPESVSLHVAGNPALAAQLLALPPAISSRERQVVLARAIMKNQGLSPSFAAAMKLARELGRFIDQVAEYNIDLSRLDSFNDPRFGVQWQKTRDMLRIVTDEWPAYLQAHHRMDASQRRYQMLSALAAHWRTQAPAACVTAIGFRSQAPATQALVQAVAALAGGRIVLQGFDAAIDDASWRAMDATHPDFPVRQLLAAIGVEKSAVMPWPELRLRTSRARAINPAQAAQSRAVLLRETMRPAATAEGWSKLALDAQALSGLDLITATTPQEEASVIALKMREVLETPERRCVLVTADRDLARRVAARLKQWQIEVSDQAGSTLAQTPLGFYLYATAQMAAEEWAPIPFLQALKHPLAALGRDPAVFREQLIALEDMALHGPRPAPGSRGLRRSVRMAFNAAAARKNRGNKTPASELDAAAAAQQKAMLRTVSDIVRAGRDFFKLMARKRPQSFADLLDAHLRYCEALARQPGSDGAQLVWRGADGARAAELFKTLRKHAPLMPPLTGRDYTAVLDTLLRDVRVKPTLTGRHPALRILTPQQALHAKADVLIVGGLTAGSWPARPHDNPWLTPQMIEALGLPSSSQAISDAAHAFVQALAAPNVLLTRATRSGDAPTVASPLLTRLLMVTRAAGLQDALIGKAPLLDIHTAMHTPRTVTPIEPPAPKPPAHLRPRRLPVNAIETLMRDPYSVYVRYVLRLRAKPPIDAAPSAADRGIATHAALDTFLRRYPQELPEQPYEELLKIGREAFAAHLDNPTVQSFWWPRFERVAAWFVRFERERREMSRTLGTEVEGRLDIDLGDSIFTLTTIADRVDLDANGQMQIIDYKTGSVPTQKSVQQGFSPQLTLEALIAISGGFKGIDAGDVGTLQYWKLSGGRPAADITTIKADVQELVAQAHAGVTTLMQAFSDAQTPFVSTPRPDQAPRYGGNVHLSRVGEWSTVKQIGAPAKRPTVNRKTVKTTTRRGRGVKK